MTKTQSNKLSMFDAVAAVLKENAAKLSGTPILETLKTEFLAKVENIRATDQLVKSASAGKTSAKDEAKEDLIEILLPLANSFYVFAKRNKNEELKALSNVTKSVLNKLRENDLVIKAATIKDALTANKAVLADFMITEAKITELANMITSFQTATETKDSGFANRVAARESLDTLFDETDDLLTDEIDGLMEVFKGSNVDFYNTYFSARVTKDLGYRKEVKETPTPVTPG